MRYGFSLLTILLLLIGVSPTFAAGDSAPSDDTEPTAGTQVKSKHALTPAEKAEKEARKACKIEICDILATKEPQGPGVACDIGWTWRAEELVDALDGRIDWPWGNAVCQSKMRLKRAPLANAMSTPRAAIEVDPQTVRCALHQKGGKPYVVTIDLTPRVTFKNGKATGAQVHWGDVSAPAAIYPLLYAATGLDNSTNVLGPEVVRQINKFIRKDCAKVKDDLPSNQP